MRMVVRGPGAEPGHRRAHSFPLHRPSSRITACRGREGPSPLRGRAPPLCAYVHAHKTTARRARPMAGVSLAACGRRDCRLLILIDVVGMPRDCTLAASLMAPYHIVWTGARHDVRRGPCR